MRTDMFKVIVERPRGYKGTDTRANRRRDDFEGPQFLGMRAGYGYRALNENLRPLQRYLRSQVGRPWNVVHSEIARTIDRRNTVQQHVYQHIENFVATKVAWQDGRLVDLGAYGGIDELRQELYVDPRTGLIRLNKNYRTWSQQRRDRGREQEADLDNRRRIIDDATQLHLIDGEWYEIRFAPLPEEGCFDVVRKRLVYVTERDAWRAKHCGIVPTYAAAKRQLSHREKKNYGLL